MSVNQAATITTGWTGGGVNIKGTDRWLYIKWSEYGLISPLLSSFKSCACLSPFIIKKNHINHNALHKGQMPLHHCEYYSDTMMDWAWSVAFQACSVFLIYKPHCVLQTQRLCIHVKGFFSFMRTRTCILYHDSRLQSHTRRAFLWLNTDRLR